MNAKNLDIATISQNISICAVTKMQNLNTVKDLLAKYPEIKIIAENRWPDCIEKFQYFRDYEKHFIGPLQSNKVSKVVKLADVIQSVDSFELLQKINFAATQEQKIIDFCFQVNIAYDANKRGVSPTMIPEIIEQYLEAKFTNVKLVGLMTIGSQDPPEKRFRYFCEFKKLFDELNTKYFKKNPLPVLSMGMSEDYELAQKAGATMIRLGSILFT